MRPARILFLLLLWLGPANAWAGQVAVQNLRMWPAPDRTTVVFDLSAPLEHRLFTLVEPDRIVIDMENARLSDALSDLTVGGDIVAAVRTAGHADDRLRIVLDLKRPVRPRSFVLKPAGQYGHRLVIHLYDTVVAEPLPEAAQQRAPAREGDPARPKDMVVAIDPGHGGEDPGAVGRRYRTREKDVTLAIARELYKLVANEPGMKPVMIRDGDYYVALRERTRKANAHGADVFISIHADSMPGKRNHARGSSVYALSERGASSALAKALADDENAADWIGGISADELDNDVRNLLGDLTKTATISDSLELGGDMLHSLKAVGPLHTDSVGQAGFAVLKSPIPSVLVETAFISNASEERMLRSRTHQRRIAEGVFTGLKRAMPRLIARRGVPAVTSHVATAAGAREHVVQRGDTLTAIARQYGTNVDVLRFLNDLHGNELPIGIRLRVPGLPDDS